jgi:hypothetical protein
MPDYRIYAIGSDGHFYNSVALPDCADDEVAIEAAKQHIDDHDVEVWQRDRKVAILARKSTKSA